MALRARKVFGTFEKRAPGPLDFNGVGTRDLAIPMRRSNQLSYEAGKWSSKIHHHNVEELSCLSAIGHLTYEA